MEIPVEFMEQTSEYFRIRVGDMVCARYGTESCAQSDVHAVFHMVISSTDEGKQTDDSPQKVCMKFIGKNNCRISESIEKVLKSENSCCELQVISMSTAYQ